MQESPTVSRQRRGANCRVSIRLFDFSIDESALRTLTDCPSAGNAWRQRFTAGLKAAKANGTKLGRPKTIPRHAAAVRELLAQGKGTREIARLLALPVSSAYRLVNDAKGD